MKSFEKTQITRSKNVMRSCSNEPTNERASGTTLLLYYYFTIIKTTLTKLKLDAKTISAHINDFIPFATISTCSTIFSSFSLFRGSSFSVSASIRFFASFLASEKDS
jgi:hypothetical protein